MASKMYAIVLDAPEPEVEARLKQHYGNVFKHTDTFSSSSATSTMCRRISPWQLE